jgi:hypothetical protein
MFIFLLILVQQSSRMLSGLRFSSLRPRCLWHFPTSVSRDLHTLHRDRINLLKPGTWLNIEFPFPPAYLPKGFENEIDSSNAINFFLTEQRLELLQEVDTRIRKKRPDGLVFAGPHGLGKTAVSINCHFIFLTLFRRHC